MKFRLSAPDGSFEVNNPMKKTAIVTLIMGANDGLEALTRLLFSYGNISYDVSKF